MAFCLGLFAAGLVIGGAAPDMAVLVAGRAVQGLGAGVVPAVAYVAIARPMAGRAAAPHFAVLSTAWVVPGLIGPPAVAFVATAVGWRWVFFGVLPLVGVAGALAVLALRRVPPPLRTLATRVPVLPLAGAVAGGAIALGSLSVAERAPAAALGILAGGGVPALSLPEGEPGAHA